MKFADLSTTTDYYYERSASDWENGYEGGYRVRPVEPLTRYKLVDSWRGKYQGKYQPDNRGTYIKVVFLDHESGEVDTGRREPEGYVRSAAIRDTWDNAQARLARAKANRAAARERKNEKAAEAAALEASVRALAGEAGLTLGFTENQDDPQFLSFKVRATNLEEFLKKVERERWQAAQDRLNAFQGNTGTLVGGTVGAGENPARLASDEPRSGRQSGKRVVRHSGGEGNSQG